MSEELYTYRYQLSENIDVIVREYADHPARLNANIKNLFCADGWWRVECWVKVNNCPTIFATIIMVRVFDEKWQNKFIELSGRLFLLCIPVEGYFLDVSIIESEGALTVQFSPNEQAVIGYLGLKVPGVESS